MDKVGILRSIVETSELTGRSKTRNGDVPSSLRAALLTSFRATIRAPGERARWYDKKPMLCEERDKLLGLLQEAAKAHYAAVRAIRRCEGKELERLTALAGSARNTYNNGYAALVAHERAHGCNEEGPAPMKKKNV
jgi:hypothetical protein